MKQTMIVLGKGKTADGGELLDTNKGKGRRRGATQGFIGRTSATWKEGERAVITGAFPACSMASACQPGSAINGGRRKEGAGEEKEREEDR